jgi:hypothetical protein
LGGYRAYKVASERPQSRAEPEVPTRLLIGYPDAQPAARVGAGTSASRLYLTPRIATMLFSPESASSVAVPDCTATAVRRSSAIPGAYRRFCDVEERRDDNQRLR